MNLTLKNIVEFAILEFPEYVENYKNDPEGAYSIIFSEDEEPLVYPFFEHIIRGQFLKLVEEYLDTGSNSTFVELEKMANFFEKLATSENFGVENVIRIGILEGITIDKDEFELIKSLLGSKSKELLDSTADYWTFPS